MFLSGFRVFFITVLVLSCVVHVIRKSWAVVSHWVWSYQSSFCQCWFNLVLKLNGYWISLYAKACVLGADGQHQIGFYLQSCVRLCWTQWRAYVVKGEQPCPCGPRHCLHYVGICKKSGRQQAATPGPSSKRIHTSQPCNFTSPSRPAHPLVDLACIIAHSEYTHFL